MKKILAERHINFYTIDGIKIGKEIGLGGRINTVLQSAFFKIADIIPADKAKELMKAAAKKSYMKKGQAIVDMNYAAIDRGMEDLKRLKFLLIGLMLLIIQLPTRQRVTALSLSM